MIYPLLAILCQWIVLDREVWFGKRILLYDTSTVGKAIVAACFASTFLLGLTCFRASARSRKLWLWAALLMMTAGLLLLGTEFGPRQPETTFTRNFFFGSALSIVTFIFLLSCFFQSFEIIVLPTFGVALGASVQSIYSAKIEAVALRLSEASPIGYLVADGILATVIILAIATVWTLPLAKAFKITVTRNAVVSFFVHAIVITLALSLMAYGAGHLDNPYHFILLGLLPVVNAIFDFFSIGITRWALRAGLKKVGWRTLLFSLLDLGSALLTFLALGCFTIAVFHLFNVIAVNVPGSTGKLIVNLYTNSTDNIFYQIAQDPGQFVWLYATFVTTLVPTFIHAAMAIWALGPSVLSGRFGEHNTELFPTPPKTFAKDLAIVMPISAWTSFALLTPFFLAVFGVSAIVQNWCGIGTSLLNFFIWFLQQLTIEGQRVDFVSTALVCEY